ncbi:MAG: S41 family peptidase, partial [Paramuribaculum sp.]|nr:S41 family peptidase [Paramuribaculum sp.]
MKKFLISLSVALAMWSAVAAQVRSNVSSVNKNIQLFADILKRLNANYVDSIDLDRVVHRGIDAMLGELDPYTVYFSPTETKEFMASNTGEYGGIGSYIGERDGYVYFSGPREGTPSDRAGIRIGDVILSIDGVDAKGMGVDEVSSRLKGPRGSRVKVDVRRPFVADSLLSFDIERDIITVPAVVYSGVVAPGIGYIGLTQFSEKSDEEVRQALTRLLADDHISGLVLDLRGNGGGYLQSAVKILSLFLPKGTTVRTTKGLAGRDDMTYTTTTKPIAPELPLVVLVDGETASSAEITAGALQDLDRAVVVGARTYGKGLVQSTYSMDNNGLLKVTTSKYYIPSGRLIQARRYDAGTSSEIPDSLTTEFKTRAGRTVRDGRGISPDEEVTYDNTSRLVYNLVTGNWIDDFATRYSAEHPERPALDDIVVTDSIYSMFKRSIDPDRLNYDKVSDESLSLLREVATLEGYMTPEVEDQIVVLEQLMKHSLDADLDIQRPNIEPYLLRELAERYYYQPGGVAAALRTDKGLK